MVSSIKMVSEFFSLQPWKGTQPSAIVWNAAGLLQNKSVFLWTELFGDIYALFSFTVASMQ